MYDRGEVTAVVDKQRREHAVEAAKQQLAQQRIVLEAGYLTQSETWNIYLQHLQAMLQFDETTLISVKIRLLGDVGLSDPDRDTLTRRLKKLEGRIEARREDMALPSRLLAMEKKDSE